MANLLLDTGPLVALLDRYEKNHELCVAWFAEFSGTLVTTEAVLTEAMYLLQGVPGGPSTCLEFFIRGVTLVPTTPAALRRCEALMNKYHDIQMDYADATLVELAEELEVTKIFTLDRRGFGAYRTRTGKGFIISP